MRTRFALLFVALTGIIQGQIRQFPFKESFDSVSVPALPPGWLTTSNHAASGDFVTTHSAPLSDSTAVLSTNATVSQSLTSPLLDFTDREADSLIFYERRSASHNSGLLLEASSDGGATFVIRIGDTLRNPGVTSYILRRMQLPSGLSNQASVRFRWRVLDNGTGSTGTIRFDDIEISAKAGIDAAITELIFSPMIPRAGDSVVVSATVENVGISAIGAHATENFTVDFYDDINADSIPESQEVFGSSPVARTLQPGEKLRMESTLRNLREGNRTVIAVVHLPGDQNPANDLARSVVPVAFARSSLVVNEIMYDPVAGNSEYVELFNCSRETVDLHGWSVSDVSGPAARTSAHLIARAAFVIASGEYIVITTDSSIFTRFSYLTQPSYHVRIRPGAFSLNNAGDDVIVSDFTGSTIDSVRYSPDWQNQEIDDPSGRSLERINPSLPGNDRRNWSTCADPLGGTPGRRNSLYTRPAPSSALVSFSPNPFSPDGDGYEDMTMLTYRIPAASAVIRVRIYDSRGRLVRTLADGDPSASRGELIWDGSDDNRRRVRMGIYIVLLEARGASGETIQATKCTVVVAVKL